jgi:hypothetical protein
VSDNQSFRPAIQVELNNQIEITKAIDPPLNYGPVWKEILPFDVETAKDVLKIKIMNMAASS